MPSRKKLSYPKRKISRKKKGGNIAQGLSTTIFSSVGVPRLLGMLGIGGGPVVIFLANTALLPIFTMIYKLIEQKLITNTESLSGMLYFLLPTTLFTGLMVSLKTDFGTKSTLTDIEKLSELQQKRNSIINENNDASAIDKEIKELQKKITEHDISITNVTTKLNDTVDATDSIKQLEDLKQKAIDDSFGKSIQDDKDEIARLRSIPAHGEAAAERMRAIKVLRANIETNENKMRENPLVQEYNKAIEDMKAKELLGNGFQTSKAEMEKLKTTIENDIKLKQQSLNNIIDTEQAKIDSLYINKIKKLPAALQEQYKQFSAYLKQLLIAGKNESSTGLTTTGNIITVAMIGFLLYYIKTRLSANKEENEKLSKKLSENERRRLLIARYKRKVTDYDKTEKETDFMELKEMEEKEQERQFSEVVQERLRKKVKTPQKRPPTPEKRPPTPEKRPPTPEKRPPTPKVYRPEFKEGTNQFKLQ
jgi:hypothetical protein